MNRLQQKCFIAAAGMHLLLVVVLFVGPAFLAPKSIPDNLPILDFIPLKTVDAAVSGGGNPKGSLPQAPPPAAQPRPVTPPPPEARPQPEPLKPTEPEVTHKVTPESSLVPSPERKRRKPEINTELVTRKPTARRPDTSAQDAKEATERAEQRRELANLIGNAAGHIENGIASATSIELKGPGGGGVPYASFLAAVKSRYANEWVVPDGVTDDEATTAVSVTIRRDGTVVTARIIRSSGNVAVDQSVQVVLNRVKYAARLPEDAKEDQRTVTINFNVKAKRALG